MIFKKKVDFWGMSAALNIFLVSLVVTLFDGTYENEILLPLWFFSILLLIVLLSFFGSLYYRLIIEDDVMVETRLFHKKRVVAASSVARVVVSLNGHIRIETLEGEKIHLCCMQDMDGLWLKLLEWAGKDKIVFAAGTAP